MGLLVRGQPRVEAAGWRAQLVLGAALSGWPVTWAMAPEPTCQPFVRLQTHKGIQLDPAARARQ
jgi:hypothetical protein